MTGVFVTHFARPCERCGFRIPPGRHVHRLMTGELVCRNCARRDRRTTK